MSDHIKFEEHIHDAAAKAHALLLLCSADMFKDYETGLAVTALVSDLADHTAHARGLHDPVRASWKEKVKAAGEDGSSS